MDTIDPRTLARTTDPTTSHLAATQVAAKPKRVELIRRGILHTLADLRPRTLDEIVVDYTVAGHPTASASSIRTRVKELMRDAKVRRLPGRDARSSLGNPAALHVLVPENLGPEDGVPDQPTLGF